MVSKITALLPKCPRCISPNLTQTLFIKLMKGRRNKDIQIAVSYGLILKGLTSLLPMSRAAGAQLYPKLVCVTQCSGEVGEGGREEQLGIYTEQAVVHDILSEAVG